MSVDQRKNVDAAAVLVDRGDQYFSEHLNEHRMVQEAG